MELNINSKFDLNKVYLIFILVEISIGIFLLLIDVYFIIPLSLLTIIQLISTFNYEEKILSNAFFIVIFSIWQLFSQEFSFFPQAKVLLDSNPSAVFWLMEGHVHAVRLIIAYPGYIISVVTNSELNVGFGYYCLFIFSCLYMNMVSLQRYIALNKNEIIIGYVVNLIICSLLSLMMNGRILFAFLGISLILLINLELWNGHGLTIRRVLLYGLGIFLTTVSSGTMMVGIGCGILGIAFSRQLKVILRQKWVYVILCCSMPVLILFTKYVLRMIEKNITYFGGGFLGVINMLEHGIGSILPTDGLFDIIMLIVIGFSIFLLNLVGIIYLYSKQNKIFPSIVVANVAIYGAFFGISTGTTFIIGAIPVSVHLMNNILSIVFEKK